MKLARDLDEFVRFALRRGEFVMYLPDPRTKLDATALPLKSSTSYPYDFGPALKWRTGLFAPNPAISTRMGQRPCRSSCRCR
jgi:hypothetical protein